MRDVLIGFAVLILLTLLCFWLWIAFIPRACVNSFMELGSEYMPVEIDGHRRTTRFAQLGPGVSGADRVFLLRKLLSFSMLADEHPQHRRAYNDFCSVLLEAANDMKLSSGEFSVLKAMYSDILPESGLRDWVDFDREMVEDDGIVGK